MQHKILLLETARKLAEQHHFDGPALRQAIPYLEEFAGKKIVLKIGGSILHNTSLLPPLISDIVFLKRLDINVIIIHGGAKQVDARMQQLGLQPEKIGGLRVSPREVLELAHEVFIEISQSIKDGIDACGYTGVILDRDSDIVRARQKKIELHYVGEPTHVNTARLRQLAVDEIPIIPAVTASQVTGEPGFNVNADEVASAVASELQAEKLILMTDVDGVQDANGSVISTLTPAEVKGLIDANVIRNGMLPKVQACLLPLEHGVHKSHIIRGDADSFINEILTDSGVGTQFVKPA